MLTAMCEMENNRVVYFSYGILQYKELVNKPVDVF